MDVYCIGRRACLVVTSIPKTQDSIKELRIMRFIASSPCAKVCNADHCINAQKFLYINSAH